MIEFLEGCDALQEGLIAGLAGGGGGDFFEGGGEGGGGHALGVEDVASEEVGVEFDIGGGDGNAGECGGLGRDDAVDHEVAEFVSDSGGEFIIGEALEEACRDIEGTVAEGMGDGEGVVEHGDAEGECFAAGLDTRECLLRADCQVLVAIRHQPPLAILPVCVGCDPIGCASLEAQPRGQKENQE